MQKLAEWVNAHPARGFLAAGTASLAALLALPVAAWLPGSVVVLALLGAGPVTAGAAAAGAALPILWGFAPGFGVGMALLVAIAILLPAYAAGMALTRSRSLSFAFQAATLAAGALVLAIHALVGDPLGVLQPLLAQLMPMLEQTAATLARFGVVSSAEEIGMASVRVAWATLAWLVLLHTTLAMFAALWAFGRWRQPGLFGSEFRQLRLGHAVAWAAAAAFLVSTGFQLGAGRAWQPADDLLFVLAAAFLFQALAVVHGLRANKVIGTAPVVAAWLAVALLPMALVGVGFADTWVRFRERFGSQPGATGG